MRFHTTEELAQTPIYAQLEHDMDLEQVRRIANWCPTCYQMLDDPCITKAGHPTRNHVRRGT